jgi:tetratricopeptide (TPR) repeat protein
VRYETARGLLTSGDWQKAKQIFSQLHADTLKRGVLPPIEQSFYEAFQQGGGPAEWSKLMREAAGRMVDQGDRPAAIALAWQCHNAGDPALADELLAAALAGVSDDERIVTTLLGVGYLRQIGQPARAAEMLQPLLEDDLLGGLPFTWRLGSELAERSGMTARSVACLDRATDIEYQHLPEVVNLQGVRESYGTLLGRYQQLAAAIATLHDQPPQELLTRVVRAADRWRSLDSDDTAACQAAARVLRRLGARELAWDYLTTPLAQRPNEAAPWLNLAQTLRDQHESDLAARAYALAFEAEPTNAQILWDHAQMLQQSGRLDAARPLLRQLADGQWQPRFQTIQSQARKSVDLP